MRALKHYSHNLVLQNDLENAHRIIENLEMNGVDVLNFQMPNDDPKVYYMELGTHLSFDGQKFYKIDKINKSFREGGLSRYFATSINNSLNNTIVEPFEGIIGIPEMIEKLLLVHQEKTGEAWLLGRCDFNQEIDFEIRGVTTFGALNLIFEQVSGVHFFDWGLRTLNVIDLDRFATPKSWVEKSVNRIQVNHESNIRGLATSLKVIGDGFEFNVMAKEHIIERYGLMERIVNMSDVSSRRRLEEIAFATINAISQPSDSFEVELIENEVLNLGDVIEIVGVGRHYVFSIDRQRFEGGTTLVRLGNQPKRIESEFARRLF